MDRGRNNHVQLNYARGTDFCASQFFVTFTHLFPNPIKKNMEPFGQNLAPLQAAGDHTPPMIQTGLSGIGNGPNLRF